MKKYILLLIALFPIFAGCTSNSVDTSGEGLSYESIKGEITYNENPTIYADYYVGQLLYLGADVIGADMTWPAKSWTSVAKEKGVENIGPDMEKVAVLEPELIITINEEYYDQYSIIAPTILIPYGTYNPEELMVEFGKILNKEDEAQAWIESFNQGIDEIDKEIDNKDLTYGIVDAWDNTIYMYGANYARGGYVIYDKLGLKGTPKAEQDYIRKAESYVTVDGESILKYAGDVLFIVDNDEQNGLQTIKELPTYNDLEAAKTGNIYEVSSDDFMYDDPYSLDAQVEQLKEIYSTDKL